jgi:hypothetical protein
MGSLGALTAALASPGVSFGLDWASLVGSRPKGGHGIVKELQGRARAEKRSLKVGKRVESGELIEVGFKSWLILSLSDNTILRINANTTVTLDIGANRRGFFRLLAGSLLTVMPTGNRYLVNLPTATVGIKGTVFFHQIYHPGERFAFDEVNTKVRIPQGINEYFCLCNGMADFMSREEFRLFYSDVSVYHNSYYIDPRLPNPMIEAPQLNHTDEQILELIDRQEGTKHDTGFLDAYSA